MIVVELELTKDQQRQIDQADEKPVAVRDPRSHAEYVLLPVEEYMEMKEIVEDNLEQRALRRAAAKGLAKRVVGDDAQ